MAFRRRFRRGFRRFFGKRRGNFRRRRPTVRRLAKRVKRLENSTEIKCNDTYFSGTIAQVASRFKSISPQMMSTGVSNGQRVGTRIANQSCELRLHIDIDSTSSAFTNQIEFWAVWFNQWGGQDTATYNPWDVTSPLCLIDDQTAVIPDSSNTVMRYWFTRKRMKVLKHKFWVIGNSSVSVVSANPVVGSIVYPNTINKHFHFKLKGRKTFYRTNTGVSTDIQSGALVFIFKYSRDGIVTSSPPNLTMAMRLKYTDA